MAQKKTDNALNILTAVSFYRPSLKRGDNGYTEMNISWAAENLQGKENVETIVAKLKKDNIKAQKDSYYTISIDEFETKKKQIADTLNKMYEQIGGFGVTAIGDDDFPKIPPTVKTKDRPVVLFYKGNLNLLNSEDKKVAVIGVLNPTEKVEIFEKQVVDELIRQKAIVISGLAQGCDAIAHSETVERGGKTIAILPSPLNDILPKKNLNLANEIVQYGGLLITEYYNPPVHKYDLSSRYINRDRLQAMFSGCVLLSASYDENNQGNDSGSRHALKKAKEYGIKRAVLYNKETDENDSMFDLTRRIIAEDGKEAFILSQNDYVSKIQILIKSINNLTVTELSLGF